MKQKTVNRISGGIAIYYGIGSVIVATVGLVALVVWLFKVLTHETNFSWETLITLLAITTVLGAIGFAILKVGYKQVEK